MLHIAIETASSLSRLGEWKQTPAGLFSDHGYCIQSIRDRDGKYHNDLYISDPVDDHFRWVGNAPSVGDLILLSQQDRQTRVANRLPVWHGGHPCDRGVR